jgi:hypothetical protein
MRIRFSNALLWRGLDDTPALQNFDVVDGAIGTCDLNQHSLCPHSETVTVIHYLLAESTSAQM